MFNDSIWRIRGRVEIDNVNGTLLHQPMTKSSATDNVVLVAEGATTVQTEARVSKNSPSLQDLINTDGVHVEYPGNLIMAKYFITSCVLFTLLASSVFASNTEEPQRKTKRKHIEIVPEEVSSVTSRMEGISLTSDPVLKKVQAEVAGLSQREIATKVDTAINAGDFEEFEALFKSGRVFPEAIEADHLESLIRLNSEGGNKLFEFIMNRFFKVDVEIRTHLGKYLKLSAAKNHELFKYLWGKYNGAHLDQDNLVDLLKQVALIKIDPIYDFIVRSFSDGFYFYLDSSIFRLLELVSDDPNSLSIFEFFMKKKVPFECLSFDSRLKVLNSNNFDLVQYILNDGLLCEKLGKLGEAHLGKNCPWIHAIKRDRPDLLELYMSKIKFSNYNKLIELAIDFKRFGCLDWFHSKSLLTEDFLEYMAMKSIKEEDIHFLEQTFKYGLDMKMKFKDNGMSLLGKAVYHGSISMIMYLVETLDFGVNATEEIKDSFGVKQLTSCVGIARNSTIINRLHALGANMNTPTFLIDDNGEAISFTYPLIIAARKCDYDLYNMLLILGADPNLSDSLGVTAKTIMEENDELYN